VRLAGLKVNKAKSAVAKPSVRKFLGFSFTYGEQPRRCIAPQALARFKARVRELTRRTRGRSLAQIVNELSVYLVGWRGYFGFCQTPSALRALDEWTRRRLRAIAWKQWKRGRTRFAELRRRGAGRDLAAKTAGSPHSPLHCQTPSSVTRLGFRRSPAHHIIHRTAGYGPVRPVVWEGRSRETSPYPD
jgi:RNA-directed DNA polymerase